MVWFKQEYNNELAKYIRSNHVVLYNEEYTFMNNYFPQILRISHRTTSGHSLYLNNHNTSYSPSVLLARFYIIQWSLNYCGYTKGLFIKLAVAKRHAFLNIFNLHNPDKIATSYNSYSHISNTMVITHFKHGHIT